ncbi:MAG TPA: DUF502 domain-containing protein [Candidatus Hydrogenedens sp.]|nr:DUF502 domain-containing protein [Candidatus Hydrogenedens sp.]
MTLPQKSKSVILLRKIINSFKISIINRIFTGLIVIIPLGVTFYVVQFLYFLLSNKLGPLTKKVFYNVPEYFVPGISLILIILGIFFLGLLTNMYVGRKLFYLFESILERIPFIKTIYNATKQIVAVFTKTKEEKDKSGPAIFIDFPFPGVKNIALVTNNIEIEGLGSFTTVFVPTTPNPTSGYFELVPQDSVSGEVEIPMDEIVTMILSGGVVTPEILKAKSDTTQEIQKIDEYDAE